MRIALRYLWAYAGFGLGLGTIYWFLTYEVVGAVMLWFLGLMPIIVGSWWARHGASPSVRAADDPDADPVDEAGDSLGSFPTGTAWPVFLVLGVLVTGAGLVYGLILLTVGVVLLVWAVAGLTRESRE